MRSSDNISEHSQPEDHDPPTRKPTSLMDLPVETRTHIYSYLLPFVERDWWLGDPLRARERGREEWYVQSSTYREDHPSKYCRAFYSNLNANVQPQRDSDDNNYSNKRHQRKSDRAHNEAQRSLDKTTTVFMRTCRQIYKEAADYLYSHGKFSVRFDSDSVKMLGRVTQDYLTVPVHHRWASGVLPHFGAFEHVRNLEIDVHSGFDGSRVCDKYRQIARVVNLLKGPTQLQNVRIVLNVGKGEDPIEGTNKHDLKKELIHHADGDISRQHIAAFLIDQLRDIRLAEGGRISVECEDSNIRTHQVSAVFNYFDLAAFKGVLGISTANNAAGWLSSEQGCFVSYLEAWRTAQQLARTVYRLHNRSYMIHYDLEKEITTAVIKSDVRSLHDHHAAFTGRFRAFMESIRPPKLQECLRSWEPADDTTRFERALHNMDTTLPIESDVVDLASKRVDEAITRWHSANKQKFLAHQKKVRAGFIERATKRIKVDEETHAEAEEIWSEDSDAEYAEELYERRGERAYKDFSIFLESFESDAEDSDGIIWRKRK